MIYLLVLLIASVVTQRFVAAAIDLYRLEEFVSKRCVWSA